MTEQSPTTVAARTDLRTEVDTTARGSSSPTSSPTSSPFRGTPPASAPDEARTEPTFGELAARLHDRLSHGLFALLVAVVAVEPVVMQFLRRNVVDRRFMPPTHDVAGPLEAFLHAEYVLCGAALVLVLLRPRVAFLQPGNRLAFGVLAFAAAAVVSTRLGERHGDATYAVLTLIVLAALLLLPRPSGSDVILQVRLWLGVYVYGSLLAVVAAPDWAMVPIQNGALDPAGEPRLYGLADHPNHLAPLAVLFVVLAIVGSGRRWHRIANGLAGLVVILLTGTLTALAALVVSGGVVVVAHRFWEQSWFGWRARIGAGVGLVGAIAILASSRPEFGKGWHVLLSADGRTTIWRAALRIFADYPVFGYGPYVFDEQARLRYLGPQMANLDSAHSQYLQAFAQGGVVLGGALIVLVVCMISAARRRGSLLGRTGAVATALVLVTTMLTEVVLRASVPSPFFFLQAAVFLAVLAEGVGRQTVPEQSRSFSG
ncbi:MAG: exopolysaccharide production protein ExoQ [Frankiaceae bacterium]|nr:exopolysaccharide production protein ExoQ [Frankiaceae bacterium]